MRHDASQMALALDRGHATAQAAAERAERLTVDWIKTSTQAVRHFATHQLGMFTIEMIRTVIEDEVPPPPDKRAWGHVTRRAIEAGYIERVPGALAPDASSNGSLKPLYRRGGRVLA